MPKLDEHDVRGPITLREMHAVGSARRLRVLAVGSDGSVATFPLPEQGDVVVGRSEECDVHFEEPSMSRRHALLRIGADLKVMDLGSSNGTFVGTRRLVEREVATIALGGSFSLGSATFVIQQAPAASRLRHVRSHDYFEARLEDECARLADTTGHFAVLRLRCAAAVGPIVEQRIGMWLRAMDVIATYAPHEYELLLIDMTEAQAKDLCGRLQADLGGRGGVIEVGLAVFPKDGRTPETLLLAARAAPRGEAPQAPDRFVSNGTVKQLEPVIERLAAGQISLLIQGETGVGKEVMAHVIHKKSPRAKGPLVCINCASFTESLLESELFGYERGAFTGAIKAKAGVIESAQGGTLFLDEVGEMPLAMQSKLLRVLEQRQVQRIGAVRPRTVDVRFIAATNRDLELETARGTFRSDLFFRLSGASIVVPPLRDRIDDIQPLAELFIEQVAEQAGRARPRLSSRALELLSEYAWPGNIRELRNVIERAVLLCSTSSIGPEHLPVEHMGRTLPVYSEVPSRVVPSVEPRKALPKKLAPTIRPPSSRPAMSRTHAARDARSSVGPRSSVRGDERSRIVAALESCAGNQTHAAKVLGISRRTLISRIEQYGLPRPRKRG